MIEQFFSTIHINSKIATILISMIPVIEVRGSVPFAMKAFNMPYIEAIFWSLIGTSIICFLLLGFLDFINKHISRVHFLYTIWKRYVVRLREKNKNLVEKYGKWALFVFVAIPIPGTGIWSGAILAWIFGIDKKTAFIYGMLGILASAIIMVFLTYGVSWLIALVL
jgi:uncharacterized membrane protein